jgi:hypothetical protein
VFLCSDRCIEDERWSVGWLRSSSIGFVSMRWLFVQGQRPPADGLQSLIDSCLQSNEKAPAPGESKMGRPLPSTFAVEMGSLAAQVDTQSWWGGHRLLLQNAAGQSNDDGKK